ncbi:MAG: ATP-binding cassette domain-containing protein [Propionibacteriaceae bacterium]|nr:ATP-binding cassette domain-containing protein [Propionibacteriaceae bacterium]
MILRAQGLTRTFGTAKRPVAALRGVDLEVERGQRLGIVGESGSGKTTLVKLLAGLDRPTAGRVWFDGLDITGLPESRLVGLRSSLQIVFQDPRSSLDPRMKVGDIVTEPLRSRRLRRGLDAVDPHRRLAEVLEAVGLPADSAERYPHEFSGGQRQRIAIARALSCQPQVLVADEPVSALDVSVRAQVINLLSDLVDRQGLTLLFVSHDLGVVRHLCDSVVVLRAGQVVERGSAAEVFEHPSTDYAKALVAAIPRIKQSKA